MKMDKCPECGKKATLFEGEITINGITVPQKGYECGCGEKFHTMDQCKAADNAAATEMVLLPPNSTNFKWIRHCMGMNRKDCAEKLNTTEDIVLAYEYGSEVIDSVHWAKLVDLFNAN